MKYYKEIILKDGRKCVIRHAIPSDAAALNAHRAQVAGETMNLLRYPDEITATEESEAKTITARMESDREVYLIAEVDGQFACNASIHAVSSYSRMRHKGEFGVSAKKAFWGIGIGKAMLESCIELGKRAGYQKLLLEVVESNESGKSLYEKYGFVTYGREENGFLYRDGTTAAICYMHKYL